MNTWRIRVSFPADWSDEAILAGRTIDFYYPTENAAIVAAIGFKMRGATT